MRPILCLLLLIFAACNKNANPGASSTPKVDTPVALKHNPKLLLPKGEEVLIKQSIAADAGLKKVHDGIIAESDKIISKPLLERVLTGRRLLGISREALRRIFFLSYAYRMTDDEKYATRAEQEMVNVANFTDWNPSHFLDVAEMTMAVAIGYDWLYDKMPETSRLTVRNAIVKKGIEPSYVGKQSWINGTNNWNQVCHAGLSFGAIAISDSYKDSAELVLQRAIDNLPKVMNMYNPDGAYPEGYSYWGYGTMFNVLFIDAYEKFKKTTFDYSAVPGFLKTPEYMLHLSGPSGFSFNYSDAGTKNYVQPAMYWFASKKNDWSLLFYEKEYLAKTTTSAFIGERTLPALLIWSRGKTMNNVSLPAANMWNGNGEVPVTMMRTSWSDPNAIYLGFKLGTPSASHAHMDIGSFVMDADGERWASDFGMQDYNSLETAGVDLWNRAQNSGRWTVFRYNNLAHNTLAFNNQYQLVKGNASLTGISKMENFMSAATDLTKVYEGQLARAERGVAIVNKKYVVVRDEVQAATAPTTMRWTMLTTATPTINASNSTITLTKGTKKVILKIASFTPVTLKTWTTVSPNSYDAANPGTTLVGFEANLPAGTSTTFNVFLSPERNFNEIDYTVLPIANWPKD